MSIQRGNRENPLVVDRNLPRMLKDLDLLSRLQAELFHREPGFWRDHPLRSQTLLLLKSWDELEAKMSKPTAPGRPTPSALSRFVEEADLLARASELLATLMASEVPKTSLSRLLREELNEYFTGVWTKVI